MTINPFELPVDRGELLKKLSKAGGGHGAMMMGLFGKKPEMPDPQEVWKSLAPNPSLPLIFYVHVPFCVSRCAFCGFYREKVDDAALAAYTESLLAEIDRVADEGVFTHQPVKVVYFGGGTPTALTADQLRRIISRLHERFTIAPDVEFTIEGRLYAFDDERVRACLETGVNRFSFGVQSFETVLRKSLGRRLSREEILGRLADIKNICADRIALVADLIYGLPGQTQEDWMERNVKTTHLESALDAVDLYSLKIVPGMPLAERLKREGNWTEEERLARHAEASDYLVSVGWRQLSTTHWGRNALERNLYNTYAKTVANMVPFGCGAGGFIGDWSLMQEMNLAKYHEQVKAGRKPLGTVMKAPPFKSVQTRITSMLDLGFFDPAVLPETDFKPLEANWLQAGVWTRRSQGGFRLTRLGEYYQPKVSSLLMGYHMSQHAEGLGGTLMKAMFGRRTGSEG